jgi:hypothetical protein
LHRREYYTSIEFYRIRNLQKAYESNNTMDFNLLQNKLYSEMVEFSEVADKLFDEIDRSNPNTVDY